MEPVGYRPRVFLAFTLIAVCATLVFPHAGMAADEHFEGDGHDHSKEEELEAEMDRQGGSTKEQVDALNKAVEDKQRRIKQLDGTISTYKQKIQQQQAAAASLANQVALLENRIQEKDLAVERTKQQIELSNLEIQAVSNQIQLEKQTIARRQAAIGELIRQMAQADQVSTLDAFLARPSLSELFARLDELKQVEQELVSATQSVKLSKETFEIKKAELETHRVALQAKTKELEEEQKQLEADRSAKVSLVSETSEREDEFQRILYELRQQQQSEADEVVALRDKLKDTLDAVDEALARGDILLDWPFTTVKRVSARFHDPTYPFRKMFEHPGIDLPAPVGTPIKAAAGGYVAWLKTGKQYGNYIMLVHPGGIATVYAHLSGFAVKPDTYVERGDIIGYSGGMPGAKGAGLSTGPHLHFEVRLNGIPVNPENYLPSL